MDAAVDPPQLRARPDGRERLHHARQTRRRPRPKQLVASNRPFGAVVADVDYFVEEVRRVLYTQYGEKALYDGGLQVRSTLDTRLQDIAVRTLRARSRRL